MQQRHIRHLKKEVRASIALSESENYRRRQLREQNNINYKSEYAWHTGELAQTKVPNGVRYRMQQRPKRFQTSISW